MTVPFYFRCRFYRKSPESDVFDIMDPFWTKPKHIQKHHIKEYERDFQRQWEWDQIEKRKRSEDRARLQQEELEERKRAETRAWIQREEVKELNRTVTKSKTQRRKDQHPDNPESPDDRPYLHKTLERALFLREQSDEHIRFLNARVEREVAKKFLAWYNTSDEPAKTKAESKKDWCKVLHPDNPKNFRPDL